MSDESLRELERLASTGDPAAKKRLRAERLRLGIEPPPRRKVRSSEKAGIGFLGWCPACGNWSLRRPRQSERYRRGRHGHGQGPQLAGKKRASPTRVCTHWVPIDVDMQARRMVQGTLPPRRPVEISSSEEFRVELSFPTAESARQYEMSPYLEGVLLRQGHPCPGPPRGVPCRPPLAVLEARLAALLPHNYEWASPEVEWLKRRIKVEKRRLGVVDPPAPTKPCEHPSSRCDWTDASRRTVTCRNCDAVIDSESGRVVVEGRSP